MGSRRRSPPSLFAKDAEQVRRSARTPRSVCAAFAEGFDTPDLERTKALLSDLGRRPEPCKSRSAIASFDVARIWREHTPASPQPGHPGTACHPSPHDRAAPGRAGEFY